MNTINNPNHFRELIYVNITCQIHCNVITVNFFISYLIISITPVSLHFILKLLSGHSDSQSSIVIGVVSPSS